MATVPPSARPRSRGSRTERRRRAGGRATQGPHLAAEGWQRRPEPLHEIVERGDDRAAAREMDLKGVADLAVPIRVDPKFGLVMVCVPSPQELKVPKL